MKRTHLEIYMKLWLERRTKGATDDQLHLLSEYLMGHKTSGNYAGDILSYEPKKYEMAKWLKQQGFSQQRIAELMRTSQPNISVHVNKKDPLQPYNNYKLMDLAENWEKYHDYKFDFNMFDRPSVRQDS